MLRHRQANFHRHLDFVVRITTELTYSFREDEHARKPITRVSYIRAVDREDAFLIADTFGAANIGQMAPIFKPNAVCPDRSNVEINRAVDVCVKFYDNMNRSTILDFQSVEHLLAAITAPTVSMPPDFPDGFGPEEPADTMHRRVHSLDESDSNR